MSAYVAPESSAVPPEEIADAVESEATLGTWRRFPGDISLATWPIGVCAVALAIYMLATVLPDPFDGGRRPSHWLRTIGLALLLGLGGAGAVGLSILARRKVAEAQVRAVEDEGTAVGMRTPTGP